MHEMSLAEGVLQIIEDYAARDPFQRVKSVVLEIGELSTVEVEALKFCFDAVVRDSIAEGAQLEIERVPGTGFCMPCGESVPIAALYDACPRCGSHQVQATGGTEMRVKELQVE
jgi:hydrogenase nickel incorporation protein HypA/HybF